MIKYLDLQRINQKYAIDMQKAMQQVLDSGWYLQGEQVKAFENEYAQYIGTNHCITCGNGLDALSIMLKAYMELGKLRKGDEIIVPANTYIATILSITENGLTPILVEPCINNFQIDDTRIEERITEKTRGIMIVHLYGRCAYTQNIGKICKKHQLLLFEDNAQAAGCEYTATSKTFDNTSLPAIPSIKTGALGNAAAHSFYPGKNLGALGDAGAITTNDAQLAAIVRTLANYGSSKKYIFDKKGKNSRMDELQAAILRIRLHHLDSENYQRQQIAQRYIEEIKDEKIVVPSAQYLAQNVFHIFPLLCSQRNDLQQYLQEKGIQTMIHYPIPPHQQQCYKEWNNISLPLTEQIHREELSIPLHQALTREEIDMIVDTINHF